MRFFRHEQRSHIERLLGIFEGCGNSGVVDLSAHEILAERRSPGRSPDRSEVISETVMVMAKRAEESFR